VPVYFGHSYFQRQKRDGNGKHGIAKEDHSLEPKFFL
jgi:hypothetical protein